MIFAKEKEETPTHEDYKDMTDDDTKFIESMHFEPYWLEKEEEEILKLRDELLAQVAEGQLLADLLNDLRVDHPDRAVEYLWDALNGLYHEEVAA